MNLIEYLQIGPEDILAENPEIRRKKEIQYDMIMDFGGGSILRTYAKIRDTRDFIKENFQTLKNRFYFTKNK